MAMVAKKHYSVREIYRITHLGGPDRRGGDA